MIKLKPLEKYVESLEARAADIVSRANTGIGVRPLARLLYRFDHEAPTTRTLDTIEDSARAGIQASASAFFRATPGVNVLTLFEAFESAKDNPQGTKGVVLDRLSAASHVAALVSASVDPAMSLAIYLGACSFFWAYGVVDAVQAGAQLRDS